MVSFGSLIEKKVLIFALIQHWKINFKIISKQFFNEFILQWRNFSGVVVNVLDCDIVVSEFEL